MNFFEYLFCRLYWWNTHIIKENIVPIFYATIGLTVFQSFSLIPLYDYIYVYLYKSFNIRDVWGIRPYYIICTSVLLINYIYFRRARYTVLFQKFKGFPEKEKKKRDIYCVIYIILIFIVNILTSIYFRQHTVY